MSTLIFWEILAFLAEFLKLNVLVGCQDDHQNQGGEDGRGGGGGGGGSEGGGR